MSSRVIKIEYVLLLIKFKQMVEKQNFLKNIYFKDKDAFPEAAVRAAHEKPLPKHEKNPKQISNHHINQPRHN